MFPTTAPRDSRRRSGRGYIKDFLFTNQLRGFTVLNPGLCLLSSGEEGEKVWGKDPVHPLQEGYERIADLLCEEAAKLVEKPAGRDRGRSWHRPLKDREWSNRGLAGLRQLRRPPCTWVSCVAAAGATTVAIGAVAAAMEGVDAAADAAEAADREAGPMVEPESEG
jgi:hypothetical protein